MKRTTRTIAAFAAALLISAAPAFSETASGNLLNWGITASAATDITIDVTNLQASGQGYTYDSVTNTLTIESGYDATVTGDLFSGNVINYGTISGGSFLGIVTNENGGIINGGKFGNGLTNKSGGVINEGSFRYAVTNDQGSIKGGEFRSNVINDHGSISGGTFTETSSVRNQNSGVIDGGTFNGGVTNDSGRINNGTFKGSVTNSSMIYAGSFSAAVTNSGQVSGGTFSGTVLCTGNGKIYSGTFTVTSTVTLEEGADVGGSYSTTFNGKVINSTTLSKNTITYNGEVENNGTVSGGKFGDTSSVSNNGTINNGTFSGTVTNNGTISGGALGNVINTENGTITNGEFSGNGTVENSGSISGGTYNSAVTNKSSGTVSGGMYNDDVTNSGELEGGEYNADVINNGKISLGTFNGDVTNKGTIEDGVFTSTSTVSNSGTINGGKFISTVTNEIGGTINGGSFSGTLTNNGGNINYAVTIGNQSFFNIDNAFDYAESYGGTLTLFSDCTYSGTGNIQIKKDITIDLNGHSIDMGSHTIIFNDKNAVIKGEGTIISSISPVTVAKYTDSFTVDKDDNGNYPVFTASNTSYYALDASDTEAVMKINGGTYNGTCFLKGAEGSVIGGGEFNGLVTFWSYWTVNGGHFKGSATDYFSGISNSIQCPEGAYVTFNDGVEVDNYVTVGTSPTNPNGDRQFIFNGGKFGGFDNSYNNILNLYLGENKNFYDVTNEELSIFEDSYIGNISYPFEVVDTYTVTFDMNGNGTDFIRYAVQNRAVTTPDAPDDSDDFVFGGWFTDSACTSEYDFSSPVKSDITLYAKWTEIHTVTFDYGGQLSNTTAKVLNGETAAEPIEPTADGYTFDGWFTDPACTLPYDFSTPVTSDITLYAKWTQFHKVCFDFCGHGGSNYSIEVENGKPIDDLPTPTADGYTFGGWFTDPTFNHERWYPQLTVKQPITLYAKWTEITIEAVQYKVTFDLNGKGSNFISIIEENKAVTKPADPSAEGFTFGGWFADRECTIPYDFSTLITADTTVYAKWTEIPAEAVLYKVTFDLNGKGQSFDKTVEENTAVTKPADPSAEGFTFGGWYADRECTIPYDFSTLITADTTVYAKWTEIPAEAVLYKVTFDLNGKGQSFDKIVEENTAVAKPADPSAEGFTFGGWFADRECTIPYDFSTLITADTTVYAKWTEIPAEAVLYKVTFDLNGKGQSFDKTVEENTAVTKPADPSAEGFTFCGWFADRECTIPYDFSTLITADTTVYAKWTEIPAEAVLYKVTFDLNGKGQSFDKTVEENTAVAKPADPTAEGFTFGGWFADRECTIPYDFSTLITADTTVYAKWTENRVDDAHTHTYGDYKYDSVKHWKECTGCGDIGMMGTHSFGAWETEVNYEFYKKIRRSCFCGYTEYDEELLYIPGRPDEDPEDISVGAGVSDAGNANRTGKAAVSVIAAGIAAYIIRKKKK